MKNEREQMEQDFKSSTVDMKALFLDALAHDGAINEPAMSVEKLGETYGPLQKRSRESIELQASLVSQIQVSCFFLSHLLIVYTLMDAIFIHLLLCCCC